MAESLQFKRLGGLLGGKNFKENAPILLREHGVETLEVNLHKDCGGLKLVHSAISRNERIDSRIYHALVPPFSKQLPFNPVLTTIEKVEDIGTGIQKGIAVKWYGETSLRGVSCMVNPTLGIVKGKKTLLLTVPIIEEGLARTATVSCMDPRCKTKGRGFDKLATSLGLNPETTYTITLVKGETGQMTIDPKAAIKYIGIPNVVLYAGRNDRDGVINDLWKALRRKDVDLLDANVTRYD